MAESSEDYELFHYGVKGMKWGVRRDKNRVTASSPSAERDYSDLSKKEQRKAGKILQRNKFKIYNEAAGYMNDGYIDKINKITGMDITFVTSAANDKEAHALLKSFGIPFKKH